MVDVLISGGTGFIGYWLGRYAYEQNIKTVGEKFNVFCLDSKMYHSAGYKLMWHKPKWDYIIHLAPIAPTEVLAIAKRDNARVLYASSGIVYHPENDTEYRQNKMRWEKECLDSGVDVVIARLFTFYGEKLDEHKAYTQFKLAASKGEPIKIWGDGKAVRSYMHGSEMARWLWAILLHGESGEAYDVGSDTPITMLELAQKMIHDTLLLPPPKPEDRFKVFNPEIIIENRTPDPMPVYLPENTAKTRALLEKLGK